MHQYIYSTTVQSLSIWTVLQISVRLAQLSTLDLKWNHEYEVKGQTVTSHYWVFTSISADLCWKYFLSKKKMLFGWDPTVFLLLLLFLSLIMASLTSIGIALVLMLTNTNPEVIKSKLDTESFLIPALRKWLNTPETAEKPTFGPLKWGDYRMYKKGCNSYKDNRIWM